MEQTGLQIRLERPADYRMSETLMREAFWNVYEPGCSEHYLLHIMRKSPGFVPELDFVAEADGRIVGQVVFMKACILGDDGKSYDVLSLGPIAVHPSLQRKGVGRMLIEHARNAARQAGYRAMLLCGEPGYYQRVGFVPAENFGIRTSENRYFAALHACPLYPDALKGVSGRYFEDAIYQMEEASVLEFDKGFPQRERIAGTATQRRLEEVLAMQRDYESLP